MTAVSRIRAQPRARRNWTIASIGFFITTLLSSARKLSVVVAPRRSWDTPGVYRSWSYTNGSVGEKLAQRPPGGHCQRQEGGAGDRQPRVRGTGAGQRAGSGRGLGGHRLRGDDGGGALDGSLGAGELQADAAVDTLGELHADGVSGGLHRAVGVD